MSLMRQAIVRSYDPRRGCSVSTLAWEYAPGFLVPEHAHGADQVIFATRGVMEISAGSSLWVIPPQFAVWIPAKTSHRIRMPRAVSMRTLYLRPGTAPRMPSECAVLHVAPLLREVIVEIVRLGALKTRNPLHNAFLEVLVSLLADASPIPTGLMLPRDPRALKAARDSLADPSLAVARLCRSAGLSARTMERIFRREVGVSFEAWRRQARLMRGIELLAGGSTVKEAAFAVGYQNPSAFVQMFRKTLGSTPKEWTRRVLL